MSNRENSFANQLKRNTVALISIVIAVSSLSYNTWRNEKTEANRNQRVAAFEILMKLSELQQIVFHHYYDKDTQDKGNPGGHRAHPDPDAQSAAITGVRLLFYSTRYQAQPQQHTGPIK
jgi:hypothetical protein